PESPVDSGSGASGAFGRSVWPDATNQVRTGTDCTLSQTMVASSSACRHADSTRLPLRAGHLARARTETERRMQPQPLENRVERLEQRVTILEQLPARVEGLAVEISQLRDEMRAEFSAVRDEIRAGDDETRRQVRDMGDQITAQLLSLHNELKTHMLMLHESAIGRIALIDEGLQAQGKIAPRHPRKRR